MAVILLSAVSFIIIINNVKNNNKQFLVTFDSNGGTPIESVKVKEKSQVSKPNDPEKEGYVFLGWTENGKVYDFNTKITKDITLVASYEIKKENMWNLGSVTAADDCIYRNAGSNTGTCRGTEGIHKRNGTRGWQIL